MSRIAALSLSMVLLLAAYPLISIGTTRGPDAVWWLGLASLVIGGLIPPIRRFVTPSEPEPPPTRVGLSEDERA